MESKPLKQLKLLNSCPRLTEKALNTELKDSQNQVNWNHQKLNLQQIRDKTIALWGRVNNPKTEKDFRQTCLFFKENSTPDPELIEAYQDYVKTYHQITSLYLFNDTYERTELIIYNTENETEKIKVLETSEPLDWTTCIAQLPNGELFCFGNHRSCGITVIINSDYKVQILPSGACCCNSSVIYFNKNIYCFGGLEGDKYLTLSSRYDLDENRWVKLVPMPKADAWCTSVIFNGNILFSGYWNQNLLIYSIEINSFSTVPYIFPDNNKRLISTENRLYLLGFGKKLMVYESEDGFSWEKIARSAIPNWPIDRYWKYNKGGIYMGYIGKIFKKTDARYCKFRLDKKKLVEIKKDNLKCCYLF